MLRIKVDKKLAELLRVGYGGSKFDDEMAKLIDAATQFWAKELDYTILYGKDSVNFAGQPRTLREMENNVRLCRIAQERDAQDMGLLNEICTAFAVPPHMIGGRSANRC